MGREDVVTVQAMVNTFGGGGIIFIYCKAAVTAGGASATDATGPCTQVHTEGSRDISLTCVDVKVSSVDSADWRSVVSRPPMFFCTRVGYKAQQVDHAPLSPLLTVEEWSAAVSRRMITLSVKEVEHQSFPLVTSQRGERGLST